MTRTIPRALIAALCLVVVSVVAEAHDLFLKPDAFFVKPNSVVRLVVLNGTFTSSEGSVTRDRLRDLAVVGPAGRAKGDTLAWMAEGKATRWTVGVGAPGTYVIGASLYPKTIRLKGADFNKYLASDGLPDVLAARRAEGMQADSAHERYAKHVKALVQVGDAATDAISTPLGYPAELVPLDNPYTKGARGQTMRVRALVDGQPVSNQVVLAGGRGVNGKTIGERSVRTDADGVARVPLRTRGTWYVKFIHMTRIPASARDTVNYESKWATLTFAVR